jgi:hypothetical protein
MIKRRPSIRLAGMAFLTLSGFLLAGPPAPDNQRENVPADRGWIGIMLEDSQPRGPRVVDVFPGGPAAFGGVHLGDVLIRIGGASVTSAAEATSALERLAPRQQKTITVERRGKSLELKLIPDSLAEFRGRYVSEMMRRDPRHPKYAEHPGISGSDMSIELVRRLFEQHERLERSLNDVLKELHELRRELRTLKK